MTTVAPWLIVGAAIALILWGARSLDRYELQLGWDDLADDDWAPPPFQRRRESDAFVDTLEQIRSLPEVAA